MSNFAIVVKEPQTLYVKMFEGQRGPEGPAGPSGSSSGTITVNAGQDLSGHRIVSMMSGAAVYASADDIDTVVNVIGMTTGAALSGTDAEVLPSGELTETSWAWDTDSPVFLGNNGSLTQTVPTSGVMLQIGVPTAATKLLIDIKMPIKIEGA